MKPITKRILLITTSVVLAASLGACGHRAFHASPEERTEHLVEYISDDLALNETQTTSLNALKTELLAMRKQMKQERESTRGTLQEALSQPTMDRERVVSLIQTRLQSLQDQTPQIVAAAADFYDGLTAEQQQTLREKIEKRMKRHHGYGH